MRKKIVKRDGPNEWVNCQIGATTDTSSDTIDRILFGRQGIITQARHVIYPGL